MPNTRDAAFRELNAVDPAQTGEFSHARLMRAMKTIGNTYDSYERLARKAAGSTPVGDTQILRSLKSVLDVEEAMSPRLQSSWAGALAKPATDSATTEPAPSDGTVPSADHASAPAVPANEPGMRQAIRHQRLLLAMSDDRGITQKELAETLGMGKSNLSQVLSRLSKYGLFYVTKNGKFKQYRLTDKGRRILHAIPGPQRAQSTAKNSMSPASAQASQRTTGRMAGGNAPAKRLSRLSATTQQKNSRTPSQVLAKRLRPAGLTPAGKGWR